MTALDLIAGGFVAGLVAAGLVVWGMVRRVIRQRDAAEDAHERMREERSLLALHLLRAWADIDQLRREHGLPPITRRRIAEMVRGPSPWSEQQEKGGSCSSAAN